MKRVKEMVKNLSVKCSTQMLCASAALFAIMMCHGRLYEPKVPEKLQK